MLRRLPLAALLLLARLSFPAVTVSTAHYDNSRDGSNTQETALTPSTVSLLVTQGVYSLDGPIYTQVLYVPGVTVSGVSRNLLIVATMNNTVYALNADSPGSAALWSTNFGANWSGYPQGGNFYTQNIGILSTPVVDVSGGYVYVVTVNNTPVYTLRKIALSTGTQSASVNITASVSGTGGGSSGGTLAFNPSFHEQRAPLAFSNGLVYVAFASADEGGTRPWHGWMMSYDTATLTQQAVFCSTPNGTGGGIWEAGGAPAVDASGNLYFATGNGDYDGSANFGQSIVKLNSALVVQDWFTPSDYASTNSVDADESSGRVMLMPSTTHLVVGDKSGRIWNIDTSNMGHLQGSGATPQTFNLPDSFTPAAFTGIYGGLLFNNAGYFMGAGFDLHGFTYSGTTFTTTAAGSTGSAYAQVAMTGSSNAGSNAIVWAITVDASAYSTKRQATLRALNPSSLAEYWNSGTLGNYAKFAAPTVASGRIYVPTNDGTVIAYGLPPMGSTVTGGAKLGGAAVLR